MKAIILAAGFGNRMSPLTNHKHKTLIEIDGETILGRIINSLILYDIRDIVIVTGYRAEDIMNFVKHKYENINFQFINNARYRETNNIFSLALAFEQIEIKEDIILIESDLIYSSDVIECAIKSKYENLALVSPYITGLDGTVVKINENRITNIFPPHLQDKEFNLFDKYKTLNIYKFSAEFCQNDFKKLLIYYAKTIDDNCYYELILGILIYMQKQEINCEIIDNAKWVEVDDPNDLKGAEFVFNKSEKLNILEDSFGGFWNYDIVDFCFIRNMYFPTDSMLAELKNNLNCLVHNYGTKQKSLNKKLSYVLQCNSENLIALNGAAQVFPSIKRIFGDKKALLPSPTFGEYNRIFSNYDIYEDNGGVNFEELEFKIQLADLIVFVNPNNPTGTVIKTENLIKYFQKYSEKFFIIDESFIEFSNNFSVIDSLESTKMDNVLVIRSMSKSYGLPGLRLGFSYSTNMDIMNRLNSDIPIWNMNSIAEFFMEIILKNKKAFLNSINKTIIDREELREFLLNLEIFENVYDSGANFILVSVNKNKYSNVDRMAYWLLNKHSIYIKEVTNKFVTNSLCYFRIAIRQPEENINLAKLMGSYLSNKNFNNF